MTESLSSESKKTEEDSLTQDIYRLFSALTVRRRWQLGILVIMMILSAFSEVASLGAVLPFLSALENPDKILQHNVLGKVFDFLGIISSTQLVTYLAFLFIFISSISMIIRVMTRYFNIHLVARIGCDISREIYKRILFQPYKFHSSHNSSDLLNLVTSDIRALIGSVLTPLLLLATNLFTSTALFVGLLVINFQIAITMTSILSLTYIIIFHLRKRTLLRNSYIISSNSQAQIRAIQESLGGIREVILSGIENSFIDVFAHSNLTARMAGASNATISVMPRYGIEIVALSSITLLALSLGDDGDFSRSIPILGGVTLACSRLLPSLQQCFSAFTSVQSARSSLKRILKRLEAPIDPLRQWQPESALPLQNSLSLKNVWFQYNTSEDWILKSLNIDIQAFTTVGFVGATGSGKSTTADLILGLLEPNKGEVVVDKNKLTGKKLREWQSTIAHVPQSIFLADTSIARNIAFGLSEEEIDYDRLIYAAELSRLHSFIKRLPEGYGTLVGERGIRLSGGQRQRIGIARALYRQASVIVFDEATSSLDNQTEYEVMQAIEGLSRELTIILIAHRLTTVKKCDVIFEFQNGKVIASGSYEQLESTSASFRALAMKSD